MIRLRGNAGSQRLVRYPLTSYPHQPQEFDQLVQDRYSGGVDLQRLYLSLPISYDFKCRPEPDGIEDLSLILKLACPAGKHLATSIIFLYLLGLVSTPNRSGYLQGLRVDSSGSCIVTPQLQYVSNGAQEVAPQRLALFALCSR